MLPVRDAYAGSSAISGAVSSPSRAQKRIFGALSVGTVEGREPAPEERGGEDVAKPIEFVKKRNTDCGTGFGTFARAEKPRFQE